MRAASSCGKPNTPVLIQPKQVKPKDNSTELILCFQRIKDNAAIIRVALGGVTGLD